jgi:hypothetical protein
MTHRNVETLIGRLATDGLLRRRFLDDPARVLSEIREQGVELTDIELQALASTRPDAIREFAAAVDRRIQKAEFPDAAERSQD